MKQSHNLRKLHSLYKIAAAQMKLVTERGSLYAPRNDGANEAISSLGKPNYSGNVIPNCLVNHYCLLNTHGNEAIP